jgi:7,8-dihydropterin-6-yl-methyl-4-(beta-D-ribofuranosyl)aminobenzene 5'-phosphate synthase
VDPHVTISILCEDQAKMGYKDKIFSAQHGFSVFIDAEKKILFDSGPTGVFADNANLLGIDLKTADMIVLSHGHWDHTNGLEALEAGDFPRLPLLVHPGAFVDRRKATGEYNGIFCSKEALAENFELILSKGPYRISDAIYFLGEIPRLNDFEAKKTSFFYFDNREKVQDFILDDTALAVKTAKGLVIVAGCSHSGICNIIEYARQVMHEEKVHAVLGGFHLLGDQAQLNRTIDFFQRNRVENLYPMHCTDLPSLAKFYTSFGIKKLCAGDRVILDT